MILVPGQLPVLVKGLKQQDDLVLVQALAPALEEFEINTAKRLCAALAQFAHETNGFKYFKELGTADYFTKYDFRKDLGNSKVGHGNLYKGRGFIHITGLVNYEQAGTALGLDLVGHPELLERLDIGAKASCWWWKNHKLNEIADVGGLGSFKKITRVVNGGETGLSSRISYWTIANTIWK